MDLDISTIYLSGALIIYHIYRLLVDNAVYPYPHFHDQRAYLPIIFHLSQPLQSTYSIIASFCL